jgi:O-methyltransferase involved in polyketide biosynthesis
MRKATATWRDHGFELEVADLGYDGERHQVPTYLENLGWRSVGTPMSRLLAHNGLAAMPHSSDWAVPMADTVYYTSVFST